MLRRIRAFLTSWWGVVVAAIGYAGIRTMQHFYTAKVLMTMTAGGKSVAIVTSKVVGMSGGLYFGTCFLLLLVSAVSLLFFIRYVGEKLEKRGGEDA